MGGFQGNRGEFYGEDEDGGRAVWVRYTWAKLDADHARWEQAFSYDARSWETNWTADFTRADPATTCEAGRPKRQAGRGARVPPGVRARSTTRFTSTLPRMAFE